MNPAENLVGKELKDGWLVTEKLNKNGTSGGNFSVSYIVKRGNDVAFLKVVNIMRALRMPNVMEELEILTVTHNHECEILKECRNRNMDKVIRVIDNGEIVPPEDDILGITIPYVIFELADGSIRDELNRLSRFDAAFSLRSLHNLFVGTSQLHSNNIAHQDIKPSNITLHKKKKESKLADLGRADKKGISAPHSKYNIAGDPSYAPIEHKYAYILNDWAFRRQACDLYLLGSMIVFYFQQTHMTNLIKIYLPSEYHWDNWKGTSYMEVLPFLLDAFDNACNSFSVELSKYFTDQKYIAELEEMVRQLCFPDPERRGHPYYQSPFIKGNPHSLEKYISRLDALASKAELSM